MAFKQSTNSLKVKCIRLTDKNKQKKIIKIIKKKYVTLAKRRICAIKMYLFNKYQHKFTTYIYFTFYYKKRNT